MKKTIFLGFVSACMLVTFGAWVQSDNGKAGYTGSPGESSCTNCHNSFGLNTGGGTIYTTSNMSNWQYVPGQTYTINVIVKKTGLGLFGFGLEALTSTNTNAGTFVITNAVKTQIKTATVSGVTRNNVVHKSNGGLGTDSTVFTFNWVAPTTNVGNVTLYYTGAACNNDGNESLDYIYSGSRIISPLVAYTINGNVYNDANGLTDNIINGTGTNAGGIYANLLNSGNNVVATSTVSAIGSYLFTGISSGNYTIQVSTNQGIIGQQAPVLALPATYINTGEFLGAGAGNDLNPNGLLPVTVSTGNLSNANFGIERLPVSNNVTAASQSNPGSTTKVDVPALSGTDAEDGALGTGKSIKILSLPVKGKLYYNNILCSLNQVITNYNPTLLKVDPNSGKFTLTFTYTFLDAAGNVSATAGIVSMPFVVVTLTVTPATLLPFTATTTSPSAAQSFILSGINLIDSVKVTAPAKYQVSLSSSSGWKTTIKLAKNGSNQLPATTIYVRYKPTAIGTDTGRVSCTSTGATAKKIFVTGTAAAARYADEEVTDTEFLIAPNPVVNKLTIQNFKTTEKVIVSVYNLTGSLIQSYSFSSDELVTIDVSSYDTGIYLCKIESGSFVATNKFVKQ